MKFSEKLQKLRKENNLSQEALADKLDVSRQSVSKWESGQTYPEMDKLLTICKIFNVTLDDLTNDEILYNEVKTKGTNPLSNLIDEIMYIIDKTIYMFTDMSKKHKKETIFKIILLIIILLLFKIPFNYIIYLGDLGLNCFFKSYFPNYLWSFLINVIYIIFFVFTSIYIYKTYFLDKYKDEPKEEEPFEETTPVEEKEENIKEENIKEEKQKIRKIKIDNERKTPVILKGLGKLVNFFLKAFLVLITLPFIFTCVLLFLAFTVMIFLIFKGVTYFGILLVIISFLIINITLIKLLFTFIFNSRMSFKPWFIIFLVSLAICGVGSGISLIEIANTKISEETPKTNLTTNKLTEEYDINDNLIIDIYNSKYVEDESLKDKVKIEINYYNDISNVYLYNNIYKNYKIINYDFNIKDINLLINIIIDNLKNKEIYDYSKLQIKDITIYTSKSNIEKLNKNKEDFYSMDTELYDEINNFENVIESLNEKIYELEEENDTLIEEKQELENNLEEYKDKIKDLLEN